MTTSATASNPAAPNAAPNELRDALGPLVDRNSRPQSVPEVRDRLAQIQRVLVPQASNGGVSAPEAADAPGETDGIACFNYLYHDITSRVNKALDDGAFKDQAFLVKLDLSFAGRYLDALAAWVKSTDSAPRAWGVLFDHRGDRNTTRLQYAVAGVNAHVNYDLAFAVVQTVDELKRAELNGGSQRQDYNAINDIFFAAIPTLRWHFEGFWGHLFDKANGNLDDLFGSLAVVASRDAAWAVAERLWLIRDQERKIEQERRRLDDVVARIGEGLLI
jgi:hypothetical protein